MGLSVLSWGGLRTQNYDSDILQNVSDKKIVTTFLMCIIKMILTWANTFVSAKFFLKF